jgi:hypothetical protein
LGIVLVRYRRNVGLKVAGQGHQAANQCVFDGVLRKGVFGAGFEYVEEVVFESTHSGGG